MSPELDPALIQQHVLRLAGYVTGGMTAAMVHIGLELGLFEALSGAGPLTSKELAAKTNTHERWVREWLYQQAASQVLNFVDGSEERFELSAEAATVLLDEDSMASAPFVHYLPQHMELVWRSKDSFRSGVGYSYDEGGGWRAQSNEFGLGRWHRKMLIPVVLPKLDGVMERLESGAIVADVGSGSGAAIIALAKRFPKSQFYGYDIAEEMLDLAESNRASAGVDNAEFHHSERNPLPEQSTFDLIITTDCLHDMAYPEDVARAIRAALKPDGVWFIAEMDGRPTFAENLRDNPRAAGMYAASIRVCLPASMSEPGAEGYGTLGLPEPRLRELAIAAGFSRFNRMNGIESPINAYYEARP